MEDEHTAAVSLMVERVRVVVSGPDGYTGRAMVAGLGNEPTVELIGGIRRGDDARAKLDGADVLVDFTSVDAAPALMLAAIEAGVRPVSGTSGIPEEALAAVDAASRQRDIAAIWAPNFSLSAVVLAHLAAIAAPFTSAAEIIEGHPSRKADAPSGTALAIARSIRRAHGTDLTDLPVKHPLLDGVRGAVEGGVRLHSVRHPVDSMISWHEVIFTSSDGVLTLRHDEAPGVAPVDSVVRAIHEVVRTERRGLIRGYESVIGLGSTH